MTSNPQITRDLLDHVSSQLGPDSMHPFVSVDLRPNRWPSEEQWAKFGAFTVKERAEVLRAAFTESAIAVYVQQLINTTRSNGFYNTTFYFVQDHLFELLHSQSGQSGGSMDEATTKKSKAKKKQDRDKERDKMLVINKIKRYEWPQDQCAAEWLLNRVVFPARNGVDVCEFTCASESYQDVKMLQEVVTHLGYYECKTFDVMRTVPVRQSTVVFVGVKVIQHDVAVISSSARSEKGTVRTHSRAISSSNEGGDSYGDQSLWFSGNEISRMCA